MQPITSSIAVDTYASPRVNASYKRANGEAALTTHRTDSSLPSLLRPQLVALTEDDLKGVERRLRYQERAEQREALIRERVARVSAAAHSAAEQREAVLRQRAARHARAAGEVRVKQIQEEYRTIGMR